jgi:RNA polymerase sigma-70 factor (ECF subfamily)
MTATLMRRVLVDYARQRGRDKRGGGDVLVTSLDEDAMAPERAVDVVALDEALERLASVDPQQSRVVELRFFAGLSVKETAEALGISPATVKRDWATAKLWLYNELLTR